MTKSQKSAELSGWIRLIPNRDGYGIPIFRGKGNADLIPKTDDDLIIVKFEEYYNEDDYYIERYLPTEHQRRRYSVGDSVPIPFKIGQDTAILDSKMDVQSFLSQHIKNKSDLIIKELAKILQETATGVYRIRNTEIAAAVFRSEYDEVLSGEPAHSAYWIQRLDVAAKSLNSIPEKNRKIAESLVVERASAWLKLYSSNSDLPLLLKVVKLLENTKDETWGEISKSIFLSILRRIDSSSVSNKNMITLIIRSRRWLPEGLYGFYIKHGLPEGATKRDKEQTKDLAGTLLQIIRSDEQSRSFKRSLVVSGAIFADSDLPTWLAEIVQTMAYTKLSALHTSLGLSKNPRSISKKLIFINPQVARRVLKENDEIIMLYRILHGEDRVQFNPSTSGINYGLSSIYVGALKEAMNLEI